MPELKDKSVVIATNFLYRGYVPLPPGGERRPSDTDGIRGDLAIAGIAKAAGLNIPYVVCDGGSSPAFLASLEPYIGNGLTVVTSEITGRGPQRRRAFEQAIQLPGCQVVVYIQAEKDLLDHKDEITEPILRGDAHIVILGREPQLFEQTYPPYMRDSELKVNATYDRLVRDVTGGRRFDWFFGPFAFSTDPKVVNLFFKKYVINEEKGKIRCRTRRILVPGDCEIEVEAVPNPEMHSNGHYFPLLEALYKGLSVVSVKVPFSYPSSQLANETDPERISTFAKRRIQDGIAYRMEALHLIELLKGNPGSKIIRASN